MTSTPRLSRPAKVAAEIAAFGWNVETRKTDNIRKIRATHADGRVIRLQFTRADTGRDVLTLGTLAESAAVYPHEDVTVAEALAEAARGPDIPWEDGAPDEVVLAAVAGRVVTWRNSMTGELEEATAPRGGLHLKITTSVGGLRTLNFPSETGFRSMRVSAITKVM